MFVKENLYYCWDDHDFMTRDGGVYTEAEIKMIGLEHAVLTDGVTEKVPDGNWRVQIPKGRDVFETSGGNYVVADHWDDLAELKPHHVSFQYPD